MPRGLTFPSSLYTIGHTPLVRLERAIPANHARVLVKCEFLNPMHSVKDRARLRRIFGGISTGANVAVAARLAARPEYRDKTIVTVASSSGERYLSTALYGAAA